MRRSKRLILACCVAVVVALVAIFIIRARHLIDAKVLRVQGFPETMINKQEDVYPCILLRLTKSNAPDLEFAHEQAVDFRIGQKWQTPEKLDGGTMLMAQPMPECGQVAVIPYRRGAEAFRLHLTYRRHSPRYAAEGWLAGHGWYEKAHRLCGWFCTCLPLEGKWRHAVIDIELPK